MTQSSIVYKRQTLESKIKQTEINKCHPNSDHMRTGIALMLSEKRDILGDKISQCSPG